MAVKNIVAEDQGHRAVANEVRPDYKRLRDAFGPWLLLIPDRQSELGAVAEQLLNHRDVSRRADDEQVLDSGEHQGRQRIVNRRLVVHRQQLLADGTRQRRQSSTAPAGEDDALHARLTGANGTMASQGSRARGLASS